VWIEKVTERRLFSSIRKSGMMSGALSKTLTINTIKRSKVKQHAPCRAPIHTEPDRTKARTALQFG